MEKLLPCPFCNEPVAAKKEVTDEEGNAMFVFSIEHSCAAINRAHLSLFFQNDTPREKCLDTLDHCEDTYTRVWNSRPREQALESLLRKARAIIIKCADDGGLCSACQATAEKTISAIDAALAKEAS